MLPVAAIRGAEWRFTLINRGRKWFAGVVVGLGLFAVAGQGVTAAYGATAVTPVPGAALLFGSGLLGFARLGTRSTA